MGCKVGTACLAPHFTVRTTLVTYVFPLVGLILGVVFLNELLDWHLLVGSILIVGSILVVNTRG